MVVHVIYGSWRTLFGLGLRGVHLKLCGGRRRKTRRPFETGLRATVMRRRYSLVGRCWGQLPLFCRSWVFAVLIARGITVIPAFGMVDIALFILVLVPPLLSSLPPLLIIVIVDIVLHHRIYCYVLLLVLL